MKDAMRHDPPADEAAGVSYEDLLARERAARAEAERALALMDSVIRTSPVGVAIFDRDLRYTRVNESLAAMNGKPVEAHLGRTMPEVFGPEGVLLEQLTRQVLETGEPVVNFELSGSPPGMPDVFLHVLLSCYPVRTDDGSIIGTCNLVVDITRQKRAEEELRRTAHFREQFLGIVGHDLRNPLSAITLSAHALLAGPELKPAQQRLAARIHASSERMTRMIKDVLDFTQSRLGGGLPIAPRPTDLREVCQLALDELQSVNPGRSLQLEVQGDTRGHWDPDRLAQVVSNLVANALQHGAADAPVTVRVSSLDEAGTLQASGPGQWVQLEVHNTGDAIPPERIEVLFEPFRRAVDAGVRSKSRQGLGLGLYIVQQIVQVHGGEITVASTAANGTTFQIRLPREAPWQVLK